MTEDTSGETAPDVALDGAVSRRQAFAATAASRFGESFRTDQTSPYERVPRRGRDRTGGIREVNPARRVVGSGGSSGRVGVARLIRRRSVVPLRRCWHPCTRASRRKDRSRPADMRGLGASPLGRGRRVPASVFRASPVPFVLMLDDFHELQSPACHDVMEVVISGIPHELRSLSRRVVPSSRTCRGCGRRVTRWSSWRATLPLTGRRRADLAAAELTVTPEFTAAVTERTEGWPSASTWRR